MSCYFHHLKGVFSEAGIEVNAGNKKQLDQAIHRIAGINYKDCPSTWQSLKQGILADGLRRQEFRARLKETVK